MSVEEVSQTRKIKGYKVTVTREGPIRVIALKLVDKNIEAILDKIERALEEK